MNLRVLVALSVTSLLALAGCDQKSEAQPAPAAAPAVEAAPVEAAPTTPAPADNAGAATAQPAVAAAPEAPADKPACGANPAECGAAAGDDAAAGHKLEAGCADVAADQLTNPAVAAVTRPDGTTGTHAGNAFANVAVVKVSELLANPSAFAGKTVALEGDVSAMCGHKRGWFSVAAEDKSGRFVRVLTAPTFLVPAGSVGKSAKAEGTVEVIEIAADHAKHLAGEHKLGDPAEITANVQQVVIRANGAEFF